MSYHNRPPEHYSNSSRSTPRTTYNKETSNLNFNQFSDMLGGTSASFDVSNSRLEPTAQEFHPSNEGPIYNSNNGAIKKNKSQNNWWNGRSSKNSRYGSGRTYNSRNHHMQNDRYTDEDASRSGASSFRDERSKVLKEAATFLETQSYTNSTQENVENLKERNFQNDTHGTLNESRTYNHKGSNRSQFSPPSDYQTDSSSYPSNRHTNKSSYNNQQKSNFYGYQSTKYNGGYNKNYNSKSYGHSKNQYFTNNTSHNTKNNFENNYERYDEGYQSKSGRSDEGYRNKSARSEEGYHSRSGYEREKDSGRYSARSEESSGYKNSYENRNYNRYGENNRYEKNKDNWRSKEKKTKASVIAKKRFDTADQRERLMEMINKRNLECLVCCEKIKHTDRVWSCMQCYHIMHLNCIAAWAKSSMIEDSWRCPACQKAFSEVPKTYICYCGKNVDPKNDGSVIAHGCGEMCLRKGRNCEHKCTILCHPGPCPDCSVMVSKPCGCGATQQIVKCSTDLELVCGATCNKTLDCGVHTCKASCHLGPCEPCKEFIIQECYCGKTGRKVRCDVENCGKSQYVCDNPCEKQLTCGNHKCQRQCHEGPCGECERDVELVRTCHCGKTPLEKPRTSCMDPIPCCDKICGKKLKCGQPNAPHTCKEKCHEAACPPCPLTTTVRCRCGHMDKELPCVEVTTKADDARCEKKCTKKRQCGKHKCNQRCCIEIEHFCPLPCNHQLSCGKHRCQRTCHSGRCPPCMETSFEELYCECGASVLYPPVPCGTKPPVCNQPCSRPRPCGHPSNHACHSGPCPPCYVLSKRWCHGHHEQRAAIPCSQQNFSCGLPCGNPMPCGRHKCAKPCHEGPCPVPCRQPCTVPRSLCGHPCNKPCHDPPCPESSCKKMVVVTCLCGLQKSTKPCTELTEEFRNIEMAHLKEKMGDLAKDQTIDISDIGKIKKPAILKILECNDECRVLDRNRRLAIGLQIRNPDLSQKLTPRYSDFMRQWAKKDSGFCQKVHDRLTELVQLSKQSKQKSRSHSFESMNKDKRHFVHEYCEHFGVDSAAYDMEPNRNVVATAIKDKSWLPSMSLLEVIQRENGQRKVPGPVLSKSSTGKSETVSLKLSGTRAQRTNSPPIGPFSEPVECFEQL